MKLKSISYYYRKLLNRLSTVGGVLLVLISVLGAGFAAGCKIERNLINKEKRDSENDCSLRMAEKERAFVKEMIEMKMMYENEITELKDKLYGKDEEKERK